MRFLVDVCAGAKLALWLRELGHDVAEVRSRNPQMGDDEVLQWAAEEKRVVVTVDKDFGQIAVAHGVRTSVVRLPDVSVGKRKALLEAVISRYAKELEAAACLITVTENRIKFRRLT
ncbi:MAG: DUF5615 family PIN-like protein [Moorellales bacterium]